MGFSSFTFGWYFNKADFTDVTRYLVSDLSSMKVYCLQKQGRRHHFGHVALSFIHLEHSPFHIQGPLRHVFRTKRDPIAVRRGTVQLVYQK